MNEGLQFWALFDACVKEGAYVYMYRLHIYIYISINICLKNEGS